MEYKEIINDLWRDIRKYQVAFWEIVKGHLGHLDGPIGNVQGGVFGTLIPSRQR